MGLTVNDYQWFNQKRHGYQISDEKVKSDDSTITYFGYVNQEGEWYIMQVQYGSPKSYRFSKGDEDYSTNWAARETLTYSAFDIEFK